MKGILKIEDSNKVFFTSDFHANHANIIKYCDRPWKTVSERIQYQIDNNINCLHWIKNEHC